MGPMLAAARFLDALREGRDRVPGSGAPSRLEASLHGSLAFTGKGHATDRAVILGLLGYRPETLDPDEAERRKAELFATGRIDVPGLGPLAFDPEKGVVFDYGPPLPGTPTAWCSAPSTPPATCTSPRPTTRSGAASS
jgi:L-serine dehydratase